MTASDTAAERTVAVRSRWVPWRPPQSWQTIRVRLSLTYSAVLFGTAAAVVVTVYLVLTSWLDARPLDPVEVPQAWKDDLGQWHVIGGSTFQAADIANVEAAANHKTLGMLRELSLFALAGLFLTSMTVGWWLSGRALRPLRRITATTREITATDLSRRIALNGPRDELRELADTIDDMLGRLDSAFTAQRRIIGDASHELRNPLAVIRATVDAVLAQDDITPTIRAEATAVVERATVRMTHLVEDLLASARRDSDAFDDVDVDLATLVEEVAASYAVLAESRGITVVRQVTPGPVVAGDAHALARAVDNLVSNAVRLSPAGTAVTIGSGTRDGWAWLAVRDHGPGIADEDRERIFDRFFTTSRAGGGGAGLGLAISRQIIESHDGTIAVHSAVGIGSTFVVWLPDRSAASATRTPAPPDDNPA